MRPTVLLVNPNRMQPPIAPIGLEYLADGLARHGYDCRLCDLNFAPEWQSELDAAVAPGAFTAILVSIRNIDDAYFASQDFILERTREIIQRTLERSTAPVILGGVGFSTAPREVLEYTGATYGIAGDGEEALPDLLACLRLGNEVTDVPGAVFRLEDGEVAANAPAWSDVGHEPAPSRRFVDNPRYFAEGGQLGIETKRGCANRCIYCVEPMAKGGHVRLRTPASIVEETADLVDQGIDVFHLCDSEFNLPYDHAMAVCDALRRSGLAGGIRWYTYAYPVPFDARLAKAMAKAGCVGINFGVDHGDAAMIARLGRAYGPEVLRQTTDACRSAGLVVMFDTLLGAPGETRESLERTIDLMRELDVDRAGLSCGVRVYPHTPLAELVRRQGPVESNPHLHGATEGNADFLRPIFYVDAALEGDIHSIVSRLVGGDKRFFHTDPHQVDGNYNYNDNSVLAEAIRRGARGAYWDILRRLEEEG